MVICGYSRISVLKKYFWIISGNSCSEKMKVIFDQLLINKLYFVGIEISLSLA